MSNKSTFQVFVSHSHKDNKFGMKLIRDLDKKFSKKIRIWYDADSGLQIGDIWWSKILQELEASSVFLIIISPDSMTSNWVNMELNIAWDLVYSNKGKKSSYRYFIANARLGMI